MKPTTRLLRHTRGIYIFIYIFFLHVGLIDTAFRFLRNLVTVRSGKQSTSQFGESILSRGLKKGHGQCPSMT